MKKKVLLLGADGMLGSMVYNVLKDTHDVVLFLKNKNILANLENAYGGTANHKIHEFDFNLLYEDYLKGFNNAAQSPHLKNFLKETESVDAVINCIGLIKPNSLKDPANTFFINSALPHILSAVFLEKLIHITTDCVYSGLRDFPYNENAAFSPTDLYGLTKSLGEPKNCLTLRTSIIGPEIAGFYSLLEWFKKQSGQTIKGFTQHFWNGITTKEFGNICKKIIENREQYPKNGLFHIFSNKISKYEILLKFKEKYHIDCNIISDGSFGINRTLSTVYPLCSQLQIPLFEEMLKEL